MFLEEQEYIDKLMLVFFDNLRGIVTDYAQAQYELNQKLCENLESIGSELYSIDDRLYELLELNKKSL
ncbi:hypothetical protein EB001_25305 [bacterium]|nr:hypothetical protein [bacterium]